MICLINDETTGKGLFDLSKLKPVACIPAWPHFQQIQAF